jgi:hypothetical protein
MAIKVPSPAEQGIGFQRSNNASVPFQRFNISPDAFGARKARNIGQIGKALQQGSAVASKIVDEQEKADAFKAMNGIDDDVRQSHFDSKKGIYAKKGAQALNSYQDSEEALEASYSKRTSELSPGAVEKLERLYSVKRNSVLNGSARHEITQRNSYKAEEATALLNNSINDAVQNFNNPDAIQDNITIINETVESAIPSVGEDAGEQMIASRSEIVKEKMGAALDRVHTGVIKKLASSGRVDQAQEYYKKNKKGITGLNQIQIDSLLKDGSVRAKSQSEFDKIASSGKDEGEQLDMARSIKDAALRDQVEARVKRSWNEPKSAQQRKKELASAESWKLIVDQNVKPEQIPLELWTALDSDEKQKIEKFATDGAPDNSSLLTHADLKDMYVSDPKKFKNENLFKYANQLNEQDFEYFAERQKELINNDSSRQVQVRTYNAIGKQRLEAIGIRTSTAKGVSSEDKEKTALFFRELDEQIQSFVDDSKRKPKGSEVEQMIDRMTEEIAFDKGFWGRRREKFRFELDGEEDFQDVVVPDNIRETIIRQVQDKNPDAALTDEQIKKIYTIKLRG